MVCVKDLCIHQCVLTRDFIIYIGAGGTHCLFTVLIIIDTIPKSKLYSGIMETLCGVNFNKRVTHFVQFYTFCYFCQFTSPNSINIVTIIYLSGGGGADNVL